VLVGSLPIDVVRSNVEATTEAGEPQPGNLAFSGTGHSIWFEWEATASGFVTMDTCGSGVSSGIGVYTGSTLGALTEVAGDFSSLGPDCTTFHGTAVTFKASAGVAYKVFVDGWSSFPEEATPGQGTIAFGVDVTPSPANDDFDAAGALEGRVLENGVYAARESGFTWNATKEAGEPNHAGNQGGASVWFSWTAPFSDRVTVSGCGRFEALLAVYAGSSVGALTPLASDNRSCSFLGLHATAGTTYRIALDGDFDSGSGQAAMGAVSVGVVWEPPEVRIPQSQPVFDLPFRSPRPDTTIRRRVVRHAERRATFVFRSTEFGSRFRCRLDAGELKPCTSPRTYRNLRPGRHVFKVVGIGTAGDADTSPAVARFRIAGRARAR
jgi:hypothetical protein